MSTMAKSSATQRGTTQKLTLVGLFGAISALLMVLDFSLPFIPPFVKMDFSELPVILGGFLMGPLYGSYVALTKVLLNFLFDGSSTAGVGELVNLIGSLSFMLPAVWFYQRHRTKRGAIISMTLGTVIATAVLLLANYFVMFPLYAKMMNFPLESIIQAAGTTNPLVTNLATLMVAALLPFNLLKYGLSSVLTFFLYKRLEKALKL